MIRVGIIGLGKMGQLHLANALHVDGVEVVAVADKSKKRRKSVEKYHLKTYDDYSTLIDSEKLDAVVISLPSFLKKESVVYASENKLDIFLDKPLSRNLAEAQNIVRKVKSENVRLMVGVNYRYFDCIQILKKILDDGKVGDVVIATSELIMNGPFSHPLVPTPVPDWWLDKEMAGGGALLDLGYHVIDIFNWMFGDLQIAHSSLGYRLNLPLEDSATLILDSEKKSTKCSINVGWFSKMIFPDFNFRVNLNGTVGYSSTDRYVPSSLRFHAVKAGCSNLLRKIFRRKVHYLSYTYYYSSFYKILELFFEMIKKGTESPISLQEQLEVMKIVDDVYKAKR